MIDEAVKTANGLSNLTAMGLFLLALIVILYGGKRVIEHLIKENQNEREDHRNARVQYQEGLKQTVDKYTESHEKLIMCLEQNSTCIDSNTQVLHKTNEELRECRRNRGIKNENC